MENQTQTAVLRQGKILSDHLHSADTPFSIPKVAQQCKMCWLLMVARNRPLFCAILD